MYPLSAGGLCPGSWKDKARDIAGGFAPFSKHILTRIVSASHKCERASIASQFHLLLLIGLLRNNNKGTSFFKWKATTSLHVQILGMRDAGKIDSLVFPNC